MDQRAASAKTANEIMIFHDGERPESSRAIISVPAHEDAGVAVKQPKAPDEGVAPRQEATELVVAGKDNMPGMVCYSRQGDEIDKLNSAIFGPGDLYCSIWHILSLAGIGEAEWTPQYNYWKRPQKLDDGGLKILE